MSLSQLVAPRISPPVLRRCLSSLAVVSAGVFLAACTAMPRSAPSSRVLPKVCRTSPLSRPTQRLGPMIGFGPARPVGVDATGEVKFVAPAPDNAYAGSRWGGNKVLWAVAPGTVGKITVRGYEVGGSGKLGFGPERTPWPSMTLTANIDSLNWRDFPGVTRARQSGCYAFEVTSRTGVYTIRFRFS